MVDKAVHILGVQEAFSHEAGTFASSTHIRIVAGPAPGEQRGDVEIWLGRLVDWTSDGSGRAPVPDDVTLLASGQRFLLLTLTVLSCASISFAFICRLCGTMVCRVPYRMLLTGKRLCGGTWCKLLMPDVSSAL